MMTLSHEEIRANLRRNRYNQWGKGKTSAEPGSNPRCASARVHKATLPLQISGTATTLAPGSSLFAMGSCFAREIERAFELRGFRALSRLPDAQRNEAGRVVEHELMNRYNTASMLLEFRRLLEEPDVLPDDALLIERSDGVWMDAHYHCVTTGTRQEIVERRRRFAHQLGGLRQADFIALTLGMTEAAFDVTSGLYRNVSPTMQEVRRRCQIHVHCLSFQQNLDNLEAIHGLIRTHCRPDVPIFITISPVPLSLTYTIRDVIEANAASKATLRAVAHELCVRHADITYFPSYEIAMHADPTVVWRGDKRHVEKSFVDHIIGQFAARFVSTGQDPNP